MQILCGHIDRAEWSRLVAESTTATWFQTPEAYDFYASQPDVMSPFSLGIRSAQGLRGVCVGYVTRERSAFRQFFTRRAIIIGGPCLADDCTDEELEKLMSAVQTYLQRRAIYTETRNFHDYSRWRKAFEQAGFAYRPHLNYQVDCTDIEAIENGLSENRKRQIKRARQLGAYIEAAQSEQDIQAWYAILADLYKTKVKTPLFPLSFFVALYHRRSAEFLMVKHEGKIIGGILCPVLAGRCVYEWFVCGDDAGYKALCPSVMATYAGIRYACANGLSRFDFMGAGTPGEAYGVRDFKARFGGQEVEHGRWLCVHKPALYKIGETGVRILRR